MGGKISERRKKIDGEKKKRKKRSGEGEGEIETKIDGEKKRTDQEEWRERSGREARAWGRERGWAGPD